MERMKANWAERYAGESGPWSGEGREIGWPVGERDEMARGRETRGGGGDGGGADRVAGAEAGAGRGQGRERGRERDKIYYLRFVLHEAQRLFE